MGDFSRDPKARLADSIAKHYVGVRMQQGVPILDADWNLLEDLRKYELEELFKQFIGDGVPSDNDGFHVEALDAGGVATIVLQSSMIPETGVSTLAIDFVQSTAASLLGFLPGMAFAQRSHATARLTGNAAEPFPLADGLTLAVQANGEAAEVVTFATADFDDIAQATIAEVVAVLNAGLSRTTAQEGAGNDFIIRGGDGTLDGAGRFIVAGVEAINEADLVYTSQPLYENPDLATAWGVDVVPALTAPAGVDRTDLVYLDVWDREVDAAEDDAIVLPAVGVEATVRLRREWAVRVAEGATDLMAISSVSGHRYGVLARLERTADEVAIESIVDVRVRNLNVAKYLKTPIDYRQGQEVLDADRFARIMDALRSVLLLRLQDRVFDFTYADSYDEFLVLTALQDLAQQSAFAAIQANTGNFNNDDGFQFFGTLYKLQTKFVRVVEKFGNAGSSEQTFINEYRDRLDGAQGLQPALAANDFLAAADAQETINSWLSAPVNLLPEGDIVVVLQSVQPTTNLAIGIPFNITYQIESQLTSPQAQEVIDLSIETVSPSTWDITLNTNQIVVDASGGRGTVVVTVTPQAGTVSVVFRLTATAARNPVITQPQESDPFVIGQPPPTDVFLQWSAPALVAGQFLIQASDLPTVFFQVDLINTSEADTQTFDLSHFVTPPTGEETEWTPLAASPASSTTAAIEPGDTQTNTLSIIGPASPTVGAEGTLTIQAILVEENGSAVVDGKSRTLEIPFVVTA